MEEEIKKCVEILKKGGVILYPTDTIWGLGCDATNPEAIAKIYEIKRRAESKSMLVLVDSESMLERVIDDVPEIAYELIEASVRPLTIIYDSAPTLPENLKAADGSIGVRITGEEFSRQLCRRLRRPIVSTSANISGKRPPATYSQISEEIKKSVDYIADWRRNDNTPALPSNIIKLSQGGLFKVIR